MSSSSCELSPSATAFSAMLTAFVGSVINGLSSGFFVAFMTGWISWFAFFRVLVGGVYMLHRSVTNSWIPEDDSNGSPKSAVGNNAGEMLGGHGAAGLGLAGMNPPTTNPPSYSRLDNNNNHNVEDAWEHQDASAPLTGPVYPGTNQPKFSRFRSIWPTVAFIQAHKNLATQHDWVKKGKRARMNPWGPVTREVTILGWFGWVYGALYAPISQILWIAAHISGDTAGVAKIVKGLSVAVSGLPLCIDSKARYGDALSRKFGGAAWPKYAFNLTNSISCILQAISCAVLLISGARGVYNESADGPFGTSSFPWPIFILYPIFSLIWMFGSFLMLPVRDGGRFRISDYHWAGYIADVGMGVFAGLFLAAPAFALYQNTSFQERYFDGASSSSIGGSGLAEYLRCETAGWKLFAAAAP